MSTRRLRAALCALVLLWLSGPALAQAPRPRVALVLSGGGARGFAHLGVLRALQQMRVPVDIVVGTSMGAVVGGAYAAGRSVEQLERLTAEIDWGAVLADRPQRYSLDFRRREEDLLLPSRIEFAVTKAAGVTLPPAAAGNAALESALARLLPAGMHERPVSRLALPFRSVASDLLSGELVELSDTPLFLSMRASLAVPGVFAPVRVGQRLLADGGLVRNLPVDMARAMGAEIIIAVNVGTPLAAENELDSAIGVARQMLQILTEQNVQRSIRELGPNDILLAPQLNGIGFLDFDQRARAIRAGEAAAQQLAARLAPLALPAEQYAALEARRQAAPADADAGAVPLPLASIAVSGTRHINPQALLAQSGLREGQLVTPEQLRQAAASLYGRGDLADVQTEISDQSGQRSVVIKASEANWGRNRMRVGLELASDFSDSNAFSLGLMHVASSLNDNGAELRTLARVGTARELNMQFWQPLAPGSAWYVAPTLRYGGSSFDWFDQGRKIAHLSARSSGFELAVGHQLSNWGDLQLGWKCDFGQYRVLVPAAPDSSPMRRDELSRFVQFRLDTLDSLAFPVRGHLLMTQLAHTPARGPQPSDTRSYAVGLAAFRAGDWAGHLYGEWGHAREDLAPITLGGFLRLSGSTPDSLAGNTVMMGRLVMARQVGTMPAAVGGAIRLGFSVELGGVFDAGQTLRADTLKQAGSGFLSVDTRFGPLFFGAGATRANGASLYLFLGPVW